MVHIVQSVDSNTGACFIAAVNRIRCPKTAKPERTVAFDCEGFDLGRHGSIKLVFLCFPPTAEVFLVNVGGNCTDLHIIERTKDLFEDRRVVNIIHECCMDCDTLFHLRGIALANVHDTSCFHGAITGEEAPQNINRVLEYNGLRGNDHRDHGVYGRNPAFWAARPLTQRMIDWASADVSGLFELAQRQLEGIGGTAETAALARSKEYTMYARDRKVAAGLQVNNVGLFIGRRGANIMSLQRRTGTLIYRSHSSDDWRVYYRDREALAAVKGSMDN